MSTRERVGDAIALDYNCVMEIPIWVIYLSAGAYIAIMLAVLGVPQLLSSYFDLRARRIERAENEANTERRHQERLLEERRREERQEELRREERRLEEERRREERRQDAELSERRHLEMMTLLAAVVNNTGNQGNGQNELISTLRQAVEDLQAENAQLRQQNGDDGDSPAAS